MTNHQTNSLNKRETKQLQNTSFWEYSDLFFRAVCDLTEKNLTHVYSRLTIHSTETHVPAPSVRLTHAQNHITPPVAVMVSCFYPY